MLYTVLFHVKLITLEISIESVNKETHC